MRTDSGLESVEHGARPAPWALGVAALVLVAGEANAGEPRRVQLENRFRAGQYVQAVGERAASAPLDPRKKAQFVWILEPVAGDFVRLRSADGRYLHVEKGPLQLESVPSGYWTSHWKLEPVGRFFRIRNRFRKDQYLNVEKGPLESSQVPVGYHTSHWSVRDLATEPGRASSRGDKPNNADLLKPNAYGEVPTMCWRDSYGRDAGTIPTCAQGQGNEAGLCYTKCRVGFTGAGPLCWKDCPKNFRDDGLFCAKPGSYGRGAGYPWTFEDPPFNFDGAKRRCEKDHKQGCEIDGAIYYPKCKSGFHAVGCCTCSPNCPKGTNDMGVSCAKTISYARGVGTIPTSCPGGENQAGLCYNKCRSGFNGVGPVCWGKACPMEFPVECGMSCTTNQNTCFDNVLGQVTSPFEAAASITGIVITGGGSAAATTAVRTGVKGVAKATIKQQLKKAGRNLAEETLDNAAATMYEAQLTGEFSWADLDPTGIANVARAYDKPLCEDFVD